jgi:glycosyltransferase involved in cell wall biosynthesis
MKIGFDVSQTGAARAGCGYFAYSLIGALAACAPHDEFLLYPTFGDFFWDPDWLRSTWVPKLPNFRRAPGHATHEEAQTFWCESRDGFEEELGNPDIVHSNNFFCPRPLHRARLVYTLYDLSFLENPEWTTEANRAGCFEGVFQASLHADQILAISHFSKRHFLETFPHYPEERITVAHLASRFSDILPVEQPACLSQLQADHFWLCVGTLEPRKNHSRLLHAFARLKARLGRVTPLVLAGGQGWLVDDLSRLIGTLGLTGDVVIAGYVDDQALQWLYQNCFAALYPSLFEGFGLPVLEAMSLGAAVITSDVTSIPEITGDAALLVNPYQEEDLLEAMLRLVANSNLRNQLKARAQPQARRFRWDAAARIALHCYEQAMLTSRLRDVLDRRATAATGPGRLRLAGQAA